MGLLTRLTMLPLAPASGVVWLSRQLYDQAVRELYSPERVQAELRDLEQALLKGEINEEEFTASEEVLLDRLDVARDMPVPS